MSPTMESLRRQADAPPTRLRGNLVMLRADKLRLVLQQREVGVARTIEAPPRATEERGLFALGEGEEVRAVAALTAQMRPSPVFPQDRFVLVQLSIGRGEMWFAWSEVRVLIAADLERHALPPVMAMPGAPIDGWTDVDGELAFCTRADRLVAYAFADRS